MRLVVALVLAGCIPEPGGFSDVAPAVGTAYTAFADPMPVAIRGYTGSAMEPFITRDGAYLLFNNSNDPSVDTNLQLARRVDDLTFDYVGELVGADSSALDGVPTVAADGTLYFVSTRDYANSLSTIYRASFAAETASGVARRRRVSAAGAGRQL